MTKKKVNVIKANYQLQQKVGAGPVDERSVRASQTVIDSNKVDFAPMAMALLKKLEEGLAMAQDPSVTMQDMKVILTKPVMELKANAAIFHYTLIGNLSNVMLTFLETILVMDKDAIDIVRAHRDTLHMIIAKKMSGDGGKDGERLISELQQACARYYNKKISS